MAARRRATPKRLIAIAGGTVVLLGFGTGVVFASTSSSTDYRTATVAMGSVDETLTVNGTIASATRRDLSFPVSGTVDDIAVAVGDTVKAGDTLAQLDTGDLQSALADAQTKLDQAEQTLSDDLSGESSTVAPAASISGSAAIKLVAYVAAAAVDPTVQSALDAVTAAQTALLSAITAQDAAVASAGTAATQAVNSCGAVAIPSADDPEGDGLDASQTAALQAALASATSALSTCQSDSSASSSAAAAVVSAQAAVDAAAATLDADITALQAAIAAVPSGSSGGSGSGSGGSGGSGGGSGSAPTSGGGSGGSGGATASAADIVADRAAISEAEANVAIAKQQLASAKLTAPIDGTVAQISFADGDTVAAGDTSAVISIIGDDGYLIESTVSLAQVKKVATGQDAVVTISSSGESYTGKVTQVGITNVSETSDPAYDITVSVDAAGATLLNGASASAVVAISSASDVLTIPLSALHSSDSGDTVEVLAGGKVTPTPVEVGAIGSSSVEITSGLTLGDVVVLADLSSEIPSSGSTSNSGLTGLTSGGGTFQGGPPAGFTPGQRNG